jgi:hypothetical protein
MTPDEISREIRRDWSRRNPEPPHGMPPVVGFPRSLTPGGSGSIGLRGTLR